MFSWKRNLYTAWFAQIFALMGFGFGMPFLPFFIQELGVNDPSALKLWTGILSAAPGISMGIMAPVWGHLADKLGKKPMLIRAMIGSALVMAGLGLSNSVYMVLVFRLLQGFLTGTVTSSAALVASGTPDNKLSFALGFVSSSTFIGFSLGPSVGGLIAEHYGYRASFFIGSLIMVLGLLLVIFLIQEPEKKAVDAELLPAAVGKNRGRSVFLSSSLITFFLLIFFMRLSRTLPNPFLPLYIQELRGTVEGSARVTGLISGGIGLMSAISGLTLSRLGDRMDKLKLLSGLIGAGAAVSLLITFFPGLKFLVFSLMLTFFLIGGVEPLLMSITSGKVDPSKRGLLFGIQTTVGSLAWFCSPFIGSWISIKYSIRAVYLIFSIMLALTWIISIIVKLTTVKPVKTIKKEPVSLYP